MFKEKGKYKNGKEIVPFFFPREDQTLLCDACLTWT